jgi:soluble lytic murein transglycosylase-like protein
MFNLFAAHAGLRGCLSTRTRLTHTLCAALLLITSVAWADEIKDVIPAIIEVESRGNPHAVSPCGAIGLMQVTPIVLEEINTAYGTNIKLIDLTDPIVNKYVGELYLRRLKDHYLQERYSVERMLAAYNGGIGRLRKCSYNINKMPRETREYVKKVMKLYKAKGR